jgi:hypothetical protein
VAPVVITGGEREREEDGYYRVPKRDLIVGLQVVVQRGVLEVAAGLRVTGAGREQFGGLEARGARRPGIRGRAGGMGGGEGVVIRPGPRGLQVLTTRLVD